MSKTYLMISIQIFNTWKLTFHIWFGIQKQSLKQINLFSKYVLRYHRNEVWYQKFDKINWKTDKSSKFITIFNIFFVLSHQLWNSEFRCYFFLHSHSTVKFLDKFSLLLVINGKKDIHIYSFVIYMFRWTSYL